MTVTVAPGTMRSNLTVITGWIKTSYRVFYPDGTSHYVTSNIPDFDGRTIESATEYLIKSFRKRIVDEEVQKIKLISVDGKKVNVIVQ